MEQTGKKARKKVEHCYDSELLEACIGEVRSGKKTFHAASKFYGIPTSTIRYRMSDQWKRKTQKGPSTVLTADEEEQIVKWLQGRQAKGFPVVKQTLIFKIKDFLEKNPRPTRLKDNVPGRKWITGFLSRHKGEITLQTSQQAVSAAISRASEDENNLPEEPESLMEIKEERLEKVFANPLDPIPVQTGFKSEPSASFCSLCLRQCTEEQIQEFSSYQSWNGCSFEDRREKVELVLGGVQIDGDICRTCWRIIELVVDFRQSCLKMVELKERFPVGVWRKDEEEWFHDGTLEGLGRTRKMVQDHVERVEMTEVNWRNEVDLKLEDDSKLENDSKLDEPNLTEDYFDENPETNYIEPTENVEVPSYEPDLTPAECIPIPLFTCSNCARSFDSKVSLHVHLNYCGSAKTEPMRMFSCTICSADFMCRESLIGHLNKHKGIKPFQCSKPDCSMTFHSPLTRRVHERGCGTSPFVCSQCGVTGKTLSSYKAHLATHKERTLSCPDCDKKFPSTLYLKKHQKVHTNTRNYPCGVCDKAFKTNYAARVHRRIHTQEKPFSCTVCGMGFAYKCLVKPHMEKNHEGAV